MPITKKKDGWYWGKKGPYPTKKKAEEVVAAIYWKKRKEEKTQRREMPKKKPYRGKYIKDGKIVRKNEDPTERSKQWLIDTVERAYPQVTNLNIFVNRAIAGGYITFDCHNLKWRVELTRITWFASSGIYHVCVVSDDKYGASARYDKFLTRIDVIANLTFGVVPILEFAWELYQLDVAYPMFRFYGEYFTPIESSNDFYEHYYYLRQASKVNLDDENSHRFNNSLWVNSGENKEVYDETVKMAKEKIKHVRELYQQIIGRELQ